ncbi:hypothetical protein DL98DRAFT_659831 [Cadophora sp. DSE1049]|nr:hypothetical protein DL98DRAFT_659831 [Cadophora sp. DSE1049]
MLSSDESPSKKAKLTPSSSAQSPLGNGILGSAVSSQTKPVPREADNDATQPQDIPRPPYGVQNDPSISFFIACSNATIPPMSLCPPASTSTFLSRHNTAAGLFPEAPAPPNTRNEHEVLKGIWNIRTEWMGWMQNSPPQQILQPPSKEMIERILGCLTFCLSCRSCKQTMEYPKAYKEVEELKELVKAARSRANTKRNIDYVTRGLNRLMGTVLNRESGH